VRITIISTAMCKRVAVRLSLKRSLLFFPSMFRLFNLSIVLLSMQIEAIIIVVERRLKIKFQTRMTIYVPRSVLPFAPSVFYYRAIAMEFHIASTMETKKTM